MKQLQGNRPDVYRYNKNKPFGKGAFGTVFRLHNEVSHHNDQSQSVLINGILHFQAWIGCQEN